jgi:hypothetical protein
MTSVMKKHSSKNMDTVSSPRGPTGHRCQEAGDHNLESSITGAGPYR